LHLCVHYSTDRDSPRLEAAEMFTDGWMDEIWPLIRWNIVKKEEIQAYMTTWMDSVPREASCSPSCEFPGAVRFTDRKWPSGRQGRGQGGR
jgi:hypothetical protein